MFDIGFWELTVIAIVALIVIGPDKLPGLARTAGLWIGKARHFLGSVKADIDRELKADELRRALDNNADINELKDILSTTRDTVEQEANPDYLVKAMSDDRPEPIDSAAEQSASDQSPSDEAQAGESGSESSGSGESGADQSAAAKPEPVKTENQLRAEEETRRIYAKQAEAKQAAAESGAEDSSGQPGDDGQVADGSEIHASDAEPTAATGDDNKKQ